MLRVFNPINSDPASLELVPYTKLSQSAVWNISRELELVLAQYFSQPVVTSGDISARLKCLIFVFLNLFLIIAPADDQCRQLVPNSTRHMAIL
jgi:hypothetical protein